MNVLLLPADRAKYPWLIERQTVESFKLNLNNLGSSANLQRAEQRVTEAIVSLKITRDLVNVYAEINSYPLALLLIAATANKIIRNRYALVESKQIAKDLAHEHIDKLFEIAGACHWKITRQNANTFHLFFADYLRYAPHIGDDKHWKLVSQELNAGQVTISKNDLTRLLEEHAYQVVSKAIDKITTPELPSELKTVVARLNQVASEKLKTATYQPVVGAVNEQAYPPCIIALQTTVAQKGHLSHMGRFTLATFLTNVGKEPREIVEFFRACSDFDERKTVYQVEHLAGVHGGTKYQPPSCVTLQTHALCQGKNKTCERVKHPLFYYKIMSG